MKRWSLFFVVTVTVGLLTRLPHTGTDVAKLEPVELVYVDSRQGEYYICTDTGQQGRGNTAAKAVADLKATASGRVFLGTAEHLLVTPSAQKSIGKFAPYLRPDCSVALAQGEPDMEKAAPFLDAHDPGVTLNDYRAGRKILPVLRMEEGRMHLEKP